MPALLGLSDLKAACQHEEETEFGAMPACRRFAAVGRAHDAHAREPVRRRADARVRNDETRRRPRFPARVLRNVAHEALPVEVALGPEKARRQRHFVIDHGDVLGGTAEFHHFGAG